MKELPKPGKTVLVAEAVNYWEIFPTSSQKHLAFGHLHMIL